MNLRALRKQGFFHVENPASGQHCIKFLSSLVRYLNFQMHTKAINYEIIIDILLAPYYYFFKQLRGY